MTDDARRYTLPGDVTVERTQPACGAVVSGIDLRQPIGPEHADALRRALYAHGVIFLRDQQGIGDAEHLALAQLYGTLVHEGPDPDRPYITPVRSTAYKREGTASTWHIDGCYQPSPTSVSVLRAIDVCTFGGDTCFASGVTAYAALPADLRERIDGLRYTSSLAARMPKGHNHFGSAGKWDELRDKYPTVSQPMVVAHHVTGARSIYSNISWSLSVEGLNEEEGQALIQRLAAEVARPEHQTRWQWEDGAIAIWDNRLVHHYGVPNQTTDRFLERITVTSGPMLSVADWEAMHAPEPVAA